MNSGNHTFIEAFMIREKIKASLWQDIETGGYFCAYVICCNIYFTKQYSEAVWAKDEARSNVYKQII